MNYRDHPEFVAFVRWWEDNDQTPTPLIDGLLERGLQAEADAVREMASVSLPGEWAEGGRRPFRWTTNYYQWTTDSVFRDGMAPHRSHIPSRLFALLSGGRRSSVSMGYSTFLDAVIAYIDAYITLHQEVA